MNIVILLLLIPLYIVSLVFNIGTVITMITNNDWNFTYYIASLFIIYILGLLLINIFQKVFKEEAFFKNVELDDILINNTILISLCFIFSIALFANCIIYKVELSYLLIASFIICISIYYIFALKSMFKPKVLELINIDDKEKNMNILLFEDENDNLYEYYVSKNKKYVEGKSYLCKCSSQSVCKIIKEVINVGD